MGRRLIAAVMLSVPVLSHAAGFSLIEQSGSGVGTAYAGSAASADDASALFFNPASLSLLDAPQVAVAGHGIYLQAKFSDRGSQLPPAGLGALPTGDTSDDAGDFIPVPNVYFALPLGKRLAFGLGVNAPFGLITEYDDPWVGRFQGIKSELVTINANPAVSFKFNEHFAIGAGANYQRADAELSNAVMLAAATEGRAVLDVKDEAYGWNAGALIKLPSQTRIGLSYRSRIEYTLEGDTTVSTLGGARIDSFSGDTVVDVTFPDSAFLSFAQPLNEGAELRADVSWTNWSEVDQLTALNPVTGVPRDILQFQFEDSWRAALGVNAKTSEKWILRGGFAWDQSPVKNDTRTVRLPDSDRLWVSLGARWQPFQSLSVDLGYAHLFVKDGSVTVTRPQLGGPPAFASTVRGDYASSVDIVSAQFTWAFR